MCDLTSDTIDTSANVHFTTSPEGQNTMHLLCRGGDARALRCVARGAAGLGAVTSDDELVAGVDAAKVSSDRVMWCVRCV